MVQKESAQMLNDEQLTQDLQSSMQPFVNDMTPKTNTTSFNWDELKRVMEDGILKRKMDFLDNAVNVFGKRNSDVYEFYKAGRTNFIESSEYIKQNALFVSNISDLPLEFQNAVRKKVRKQLHVNDTKGLIIKPNSQLSRQITNTKVFKEAIKPHISSMLQGNVINSSVGLIFIRAEFNVFFGI